jgi:uncharacterized membrane protein YvbJ
MYCVNCGKEVVLDFKFCPNCGNTIDSKKEIVSIPELKDASGVLIAGKGDVVLAVQINKFAKTFFYSFISAAMFTIMCRNTTTG